MTTLPFGKYRGWSLDQVPVSYLAWLLDECDVREPLRTEIADEILFRLDLSSPPPPPPPPARPPAELVPVVAEIVNTGYRALAVRRHPDKGGDHATMQRLNEARDWLRARGL